MMMSVLMGASMSLCMSLCGSLLSGHFEVPSWLFSLIISFIISLIIGFVVPMKPLSDKLCAKFGADPNSTKGKVLSALLSDIIYTPFLTFVMCFAMTTLAGMSIDRQASALEAQINDLTAQQTEQRAKLDDMNAQLADIEAGIAHTEDPEELGRLNGAKEGIQGGIKEVETSIADMQGGIDGMTSARTGMLASKPSFFREVWLSLAVCLVLGFILAFFLQPLFFKLLIKKYGMKPQMANK